MTLLNARSARYAWNFLRGKLVHANLQILYDCNFKCRICDFWTPEFGTRPRMSLEDAETLSDRLAELSPMIVSVGGGEPLLHPDLLGIVRALSRHHFPVMICNGWYMTPGMARSLFEAGLWEVSISVDYADAARHDAQRGTPGAYDRALAALRMLGENRVHPHQRVHMISVVMEDNLDDLEPLILKCRELGITHLVTLYSPKRGSRGWGRIPERDVSTHLLDLKARYPEFVQLRGYIGRFSEALEKEGIGPCQAGRMLCNIDCQGEVSRCIDRLEESAGNLLSDPPRDVAHRLLAMHARQDCSTCWTSCRGTLESLRIGPGRLASLRDYVGMVKAVPLA